MTALSAIAPDMPRLSLAPGWTGGQSFAAIADILAPRLMMEAQVEISGWPDYAPTPLTPLPGLAEALGVGTVWCKDESQRFGLGGVKALGAPYGLSWLLRQNPAISVSEAEAVAATDGNHGLALAWAARNFGCSARIFVGLGVDAPRLDRLRQAGANIQIVPGTYDDAVDAAARYAAAADTRLLVTDTDYAGGLPVTLAVMAGYTLLGRELAEQLAEEEPSHIFLHCGVGCMAASVLAGYWQARGKLTPQVILVEPKTAACLQASLDAGRETSVPGDLATRMVGLSCGRPSRPAWQILHQAAFAAIALEEDGPRALQAALWRGTFGDSPLWVGDTGVAGLAGLAASAQHLREELRLGPHSRVLTINSEPPLPGQL